jgi:hypothetical protein
MQSAHFYPTLARESYTQTIAFKAGLSLEKFYLQKASELGVPVANLYREALLKFSLAADVQNQLQETVDLSIANTRIRQLEEEVHQLRLQALPLLRTEKTPNERALEAFANERVTLAMRKLAESVEKGTVLPKSYEMIHYFLTFCPQ